jgi:hypothetical protein
MPRRIRALRGASVFNTCFHLDAHPHTWYSAVGRLQRRLGRRFVRRLIVKGPSDSTHPRSEGPGSTFSIVPS